MEKFRTYGSLFLAMLSSFTLGGYTCSTLKYNEPVELYRWIFTSIFGLMFLVNFLFEFKQQADGK